MYKTNHRLGLSLSSDNISLEFELSEESSSMIMVYQVEIYSDIYSEPEVYSLAFIDKQSLTAEIFIVPDESSIIFYEHGFVDIHISLNVEVALGGYPNLQFDGYTSALMDKLETSSCSITGLRTIVKWSRMGNYTENELVDLNIDDCKIS